MVNDQTYFNQQPIPTIISRHFLKSFQDIISVPSSTYRLHIHKMLVYILYRIKTCNFGLPFSTQSFSKFFTEFYDIVALKENNMVIGDTSKTFKIEIFVFFWLFMALKIQFLWEKSKKKIIHTTLKFYKNTVSLKIK